ncbi:MAG TPA: DUF1800 domain-containing protein [Rhodocyclaceae bacterium]|nr:DUF1800 domain-containing protein [Rhodocyclaceae bacterium]
MFTLKMAWRRIGLACCASASLVAVTPAATLAATKVKAVQKAVQKSTAENASDDARWLARLAYGINTTDWMHLRKIGRKAWLDEQLHGDMPLPDFAQAQVDAYLGAPQPLPDVVTDLETEKRRVNALPDGDDKQTARKALNDRAESAWRNAVSAQLVRDLYSPDQLREQMTAFWLNWFSVYRQKDNIRVLVADYQERAIRPHALGKFRDLLLATARHPAMLLYLDNFQNAAGKINENYARELMELHTLGIDGGYTQQDVQELARVLTGVGVNLKHESRPGVMRLPPDLQSQYQYDADTGFEFNPIRHDRGDKQILGTTIGGGGWDEVASTLDMLARQPATARHVSERMAEYFLGEVPPPALVQRMSETFLHTDGDIAATLRTLLNSKTFSDSVLATPGSAPRKFKDPQHFVVSALRFAYDGKRITNLRPVMNWLAQLGELPFDHLTPEGYGLLQKDWASSGQLAKRFEIARTIGSGNDGLFNAPDDGANAAAVMVMPDANAGFPMLSSKLYFDLIEPQLTQTTRDTLNKAASQQEWNMLLLSSPEFMYQ